ncbi:MAG: hypothetical protein HKL96_08295 [Phycisphaerales bacterium]|nr:hypothetical protein [Phycisphaerales bacterium]
MVVRKRSHGFEQSLKTLPPKPAVFLCVSFLSLANGEGLCLEDLAAALR